MKFDLEDALLALGVLFVEAGVAVIYWPASFILAGLICLTLVALIERTKSKSKQSE